MGMQTDVKSTTIAASNTGVAVNNAPRARLKAITINAISVIAGTVTITDGSGGITLFSSLTPAVIGVTHILIPGEGILAQNNLYVVTGAGASAIIFYG